MSPDKLNYQKGDWTEMDDDIREFGMNLGGLALARDWGGVHDLLSPWLQKDLSVEGVKTFFEDEYRRTLGANGVEEMFYPEYPEPGVDGNTFMNATELRKPISWEGDRIRNIPPELTDTNVKYWMNLKLYCSDEQMQTLSFDTFTDIWLSVAESDGRLCVGYWSCGAY